MTYCFELCPVSPKIVLALLSSISSGICMGSFFLFGLMLAPGLQTLFIILFSVFLTGPFCGMLDWCFHVCTNNFVSAFVKAMFCFNT